MLRGLDGANEIFKLFGTSEVREGDEEEERVDVEDNDDDRMSVLAVGRDEAA